MKRGGGLFGRFLAHAMYHVEWLAGPLVRIEARVRHDDRGAAAVEFEGEVVGKARIAVRIETRSDGPLEHHILVKGQTGEAHLRNIADSHGGPFELKVRSGRDWTWADPDTADGDARVAPVAALAGRLVSAIRDGHDVRPDLRDGARVQDLLEYVWLSSDEERGVAVP